jgi:4-amino-4-deoxy-L-arabinose transferase-like glycosyltransferase
MGELEPSRASWALAVRARPGAGACLALVLLALALYAPYLGAEELHYEEARRALPAREMLASGDWVLPTIWGRAYLAKPPLLYWCIAGLGALRGAIDEVTTRLPSLLATLLTAPAILALGARWFSRRAGIAAALCWLLAPAVFNKGALGELEALLALCVLGALAALPAAVAGSWRAAAACGLCLGAALLTKGPPALIFLGAAWLALARVQAPAGKRIAAGVLRDPRALAALALGLGLAFAWAALLLARLDPEKTLAFWRGELDRTGGTGLRELVGDRLEFPPAFFGGVLAASLCLFVVADRASWRTLRAQPACAWLAGTLVVALALLVCFAPRHRYAYPLTPLLALLGGALFDASCAQAPGAPAPRRARALALLFALAGLAVGASALPALRRAAGLELDYDAWGLAAALLGLGAGLWLALASRRAPLARLGLGAVLVLVAVRLVIVTQYDPARAERRGYRRTAARIEALVPADATLHTSQWMHFNELFYVRRSVRAVPDLRDVPPGGHAFVRDPAAEVARGFRVLGAVPLGGDARGVVLLRAPANGD